MPPGRGSISPANPGVGGSAGAAPVGPQGPAVEGRLPKQVKFFGFHTEASLLARLAAMGISPTLPNLRVAQQLLRYNQGLEPNAVANLAHMWAQHGGNDVVQLEAMVALIAMELPLNGGNIAAMRQLLAGGPLSHLLARLTMGLKAENDPKLAPLGKQLTQFWQLGHLKGDALTQLGLFQKQIAALQTELAKLNPLQHGDAVATELSRLSDLFSAHKLLASQDVPHQYLPFFIWRDQQPLPGELVVTDEGGGGELGAGAFTKVTIAVETQHMGRVTVELTFVRDQLSARFDVGDEKLKKLIDAKLVLLRQRLMGAPYNVDLLTCRASGSARAVSALLPARRDLKRLGRAQGIM